MKKRGEIILGDRSRRKRSQSSLGRKVRNVIILLFLAGIVTWSLESMETKTRIRQARVDVSRIGHAARLFRADFGRCPIGMDELLFPPKGTPYMKQEADPWGRPYQLICPARHDPGGVDVLSGGPDGNKTGRDNISSL